MNSVGEYLKDYEKALDIWVDYCKQLSDVSLIDSANNNKSTLEKEQIKCLLKKLFPERTHFEDQEVDASDASVRSEFFDILHMPMTDVVDILDDMASEMSANMDNKNIDKLKENLPCLVALKKAIEYILIS